MALTDKLTAIANAIRAKTGNMERLTLDQMVTEIYGTSASETSVMKYYLTARASDGYQFYSYKGTYETLAGLLKYGDTSLVTDMNRMFSDCSKLTTIPQLDTSKVTDMNNMFRGCSRLTTVPQLDTSKVTDMSSMFSGCSHLTTVPQLDISNVAAAINMFYNCSKLTDCKLRNIKADTQVGFGTFYGHLLTLDSLLFMIGELRDTGSSKTFTVGSANLEKLADVYVKTVTITDEMRAEDEYIDEKLPFEVCESTDEGAILINNYVTLKNWQLA